MQKWNLLMCCLLVTLMAFAQGIPPVGQWREHLPWNNAIGVSASGNQIYCATPYAAFIYDQDDNSFVRRSKVNGLSDVGVSAFCRDAKSGIGVIAYNNSNLDIWKEDRVFNVPDIRISSVGGDKSIRRITIHSGIAYLSTGLGIILIDLDRYQVKDTWRIGEAGVEVPVWGVAITNDKIYAATEQGLRVCPRSTNPADYRNWSRVTLSAGRANQVISAGSSVYVQFQDTIFKSGTSDFTLHYKGRSISGIDSSGNGLLVSESGSQAKVSLIDENGAVGRIISVPGLAKPEQAILVGSDCWIADRDNGLFRVGNNNTERIFPNSPINISTGQMILIGDAIWAAAGTVNDAWNYTYNPNGAYRFSGQYWDGYNRYVYPKMDSVLDVITIAGQASTGSVFLGSYGGGLVEIKKDNTLTIHKQNSPLQPAIGDPGSYRVSGLAADNESNIWISNYGAPQNLHVYKADGSWRSFSIPFLHSENAVAGITIDDLGQKWIVSPKGNGLFVYNSGTQIDNTSDDQWKFYKQGRGNGNLPSDNVNTVIKDKNGFIWVGTDKGIAVINCVQEAASSSCEAILPIVQTDNFAGFLFGDEDVLSMAVDGANRKWVGTRNGLWLIGAEGDKIEYRFTRSNSPLLADEISALTVDPVTGEVFIATSSGICSFRSTATDPGITGTNVLVYPNPVPPGYNGSIAVRGLPPNSVVKITELDGRLVFQGRSLGGQFVWNGRDYKGNKASSGVYLVLVADEQNREKLATKIFFTR